jgi:hypothetical protein
MSATVRGPRTQSELVARTRDPYGSDPTYKTGIRRFPTRQPRTENVSLALSICNRINAARRAIGDNGKNQALMRTVPRRGFRFVGEVHDDIARAGIANDVAAGAKAVSEGPVSSLVQEVRFCRSDDGVNLALPTCGIGFPLVRSGTWLTHIQRDWESPVWEPLFRGWQSAARTG